MEEEEKGTNFKCFQLQPWQRQPIVFRAQSRRARQQTTCFSQQWSDPTAAGTAPHSAASRHKALQGRLPPQNLRKRARGRPRRKATSTNVGPAVGSRRGAIARPIRGAVGLRQVIFACQRGLAPAVPHLPGRLRAEGAGASLVLSRVSQGLPPVV